MKTYKYLTDLGIPVENQMMNETLFNPNETRIDYWNDYEEEYGVLPPFTWEFGNVILPQWLYIQIRAYKDQATIINHNFHKAVFNGKEYGVGDLTDILIDDLAWVVLALHSIDYWDIPDYGWSGKSWSRENVIKQREVFDIAEEKFTEALTILALIHGHLWW